MRPVNKQFHPRDPRYYAGTYGGYLPAPIKGNFPMKHLALRLFGAAVSSRLGQALLWRIVTPHRHLHDLDGTVYMGRWRVVDEDTFAGRVLERLTGYASARLHLIKRADHYRDLHNHPFDYRTFIVDGGYIESYSDGIGGVTGIRSVTRGDTATGNASKFHRIAHVWGSHGGVLTLFFMTRNKAQGNSSGWGFDVGGKFVESTKYLLRKGYRREQVQEVQTR